LIAPLLVDFRSLYPDVQIDLVLSHLNLDLVEAQIDVALRMGPLPDSSMVARRLAEPHLMPALPIWRGMANRPSYSGISHSSLEARRGGGYAWPMSDGGPVESYEISPVIEADDAEVLKAALFAGAGLMMATDMIMHRHMPEGLVRPVLPGWVGRCPELHAVFPRGRVQQPKLRAFVDFLVSSLSTQGAIATAGNAAIGPAR
jgi:DNA-binding transcriptional LysR family regulator